MPCISVLTQKKQLFQEKLSHIAECSIASNMALGRFRGAAAPVTPGPPGRCAAGGGLQLNATRDPSPSPSVVSAASTAGGASGAKWPRLDATATPANPGVGDDEHIALPCQYLACDLRSRFASAAAPLMTTSV